MHLKLSLIKFLIKSSIFIALSAVFYVFYFTEVIHKYADGYTNMAIIKETLQNGMKPPYLTMVRNICFFFSCRSLKTREKYISFAQLVLLSLFIV